MSGRLFKAFGMATTVTTSDGTIETRVLVDEKTRVLGELGVRLDARPSAVFPVADVGAQPSGTFTVGGKTWRIQRPVADSIEGSATQIRVWVSPA